MRSSMKSKSQGLVEFALILPVLVLIIFGLIETGRLIFTYSSVVSASREATRYASATGTSPRGVPYYQDCRGIRDAAKRMAFINPLEDAQITIQYDNGPGTTLTPYCAPGNDVDISFIPQPGSRVLVSVEMNFLPLVPGLLPYPSFTIIAPNARTILVPVPVGIPPGGGGSSTSPLTLTKSANPSRFFKAGQTIQYTYTVRNNTTGTLSYIYVSDDRISNVTCASTTLGPNASTTCTATYTTTDRDVNNQAITNTAVATGRRSNGVVVYSNQAQLTIPFVRAELSLTKQANPTVGAVGTIITYSYTLTNTGDVELYAPYAVTDNKVSGIICPNTPSPLPTGQSITCTKTYTITSADANARQVINVATATATLDGHTVTSNQAQARVLVSNLNLQVTANPSVVAQAGTSVTFTYTVTNIGGSTLTGLTITDTLVAGISCGTTTLNAGQSTTCTGTYTVTQNQLDNGAPLTSQATASGIYGSSSVSSPTVTTTITLQRLPALSLQISATPNPVTPDPVTNPPAGKTVTYTYTIQNTGNVTLQSPYAVTDDKIGNAGCSGATSPLLPGQSTTCTKSYIITNADVQNGSIISTATAKAKDTNGNEIVSNPASYTLIVWNAPRLSVSLNASPSSTTKGGTVSLTFTVKNTGNQDLSSVTVSYNVNNTPEATIPCITMLKIGQSFRCFASYTVPSNYVSRIITFQAKAAAQSPNVESTPTDPLVVTVVDCNVTILSLTSNNNEIQMRINNGQNQFASINRLQITWNNPNTLSKISLNTVDLWSGSTSTSPFSLTPSNATISPLSQATLKFTFQNSYIRSPLDSIVVDFGGGCTLIGRWP